MATLVVPWRLPARDVLFLLVLSAALTVAPVPLVPLVAFLAYSAVPLVPPDVVAIAPVPGFSRVIGSTPIALSTAPHRGSDAGSGRGTSRSCAPAWLSPLELDCVRVVAPVAARAETSSALLSRPWILAFASGKVAALVLVRSTATVLDDLVLAGCLSSRGNLRDAVLRWCPGLVVVLWIRFRRSHRKHCL